MLAVNQDLADAITAPERTVRIRLSCDWDGDGHGPAGSIDDLSGQAAKVSVTSVLQGTQPDQAAVVEGSAAATITVDLAAGDTDDERLHAVRYFAVSSTSSPLAGKPKLGRDLQADVQFLTASGWQGVPLVRGVSRSLPARVADRSASLQGLDYRSRLRTPVALPAMAADPPVAPGVFPTKPGLEATWVASYVLSQCGFPMSPPPRSQCRWFAPMHGSAMPFIAEPFKGSRGSLDYDSSTQDVRACSFGAGPYLLATARTPGTRLHQLHGSAAAGSPMFDANGRSSGRIECWYQPDGTEWTGSSVDVETINLDAAIICEATFNAGSIGTGGLLQLVLRNDLVTRTINGPSVPIDGQWHQVGVHWDDAAGTATFMFDGSTTTVAFTPTPATVGGTDDGWVIEVDTAAPIAEVQITTGIPASTAWQPATYTVPAVVDRLQNRLDGIVPGDATEGWLILQELAAAEQGAVWLDPDGRPQIASRGRLVSTPAQVAQRTVDSSRDMLDLAYDYHLDKVANIITAPYQAVGFVSQAHAWSLTETVTVPPGQSVTVLASYTGLATNQRFLTGSANTVQDGTGTQYQFGTGITPGAVTATITYTSDTTATIVVTSSLGVPVWLVGTDGRPNVAIIGDTISQAAGPSPPVVVDAASRAEYGDVPLTLTTNRWLQRRDFAWGMAIATAADLGQPQPVFSEIPIPGDPRLEFFDRLTLVDPDNTELHDDVWYVGSTHTIEANGRYEQQLVCRPARDRYLAGVGLAGVDLVG